MLKSTNIIAFALSLYAGLVVGSTPPVPPEMTLVSEASGRTSIEVDCSLTQNSKQLECTFYQMSITYDLEPSKLKETITKEVDKLNNDHPDYKNILAEIKGLCPGEAFKLNDSLKEEGQRFAFTGIQGQACKVTTLEQAKAVKIDVINVLNMVKAVTCRAWPNKWKETFSVPLGGDGSYWLSSPQPDMAVCGIINVSTLTEESSGLWRYESKRIVTNRKGRAGLRSCKDIPERTSAFSWRGKSQEVNCEHIKYGY
jgi:hypothetical protein